MSWKPCGSATSPATACLFRGGPMVVTCGPSFPRWMREIEQQQHALHSPPRQSRDARSIMDRSRRRYMFIGGQLDSQIETRNTLARRSHTVLARACVRQWLSAWQRQSVQSWPPSRLPLQPAPDLPSPRGMPSSNSAPHLVLQLSNPEI